MDLEHAFLRSLAAYNVPNERAQRMWTELLPHYAEKHRHYHTLFHLQQLHMQLEPLLDRLEEPGPVLWAIAYHDVVYSVTRRDNEERSAELAGNALRDTGVPQALVDRCHAHILATKKHDAPGDADTDLFTDADLSILGAKAEDYMRYAEQVRAEYHIYPDLLYKPGRRKVLEHFLAMPRIFKTTYFFDRYEAAARENLRTEMERL
jgi:predicted metal-dependent HD superfamily phosphohydrolase